ncbi:3-oxoacyl-[acyl-carrier protein] reductase [Kaistia hirudinis]|uniref:3-oxoacyl-[acyl-carrier protein] reductase n=1 Tax=Kaistia hirudinis TaxID=1293440 RepID=A0A840AN09_9HYPH|nr:SDR family NAD(P)-dependent oxidoreductase [Kaistia hirudinis]MBB3929806.1 3-oxoacyl-[acyl-carrier protein] reductase [Kaistia hirudinis]
MSAHQTIALVTGAAGGIGASIARKLADLGCRVLLVDIAPEPLEKLAAELPGGAEAVVLDLSDTAAVEAAIEQLTTRFGGIDVLVNNAGILSNNKIATTSMDEWHRVTAINVDAAFVLSRGVLPGMRAKRWGRIVNISSYAAKSGGLTAGTAYSVSKASMIGLTFSIARETAAEGITANAIAPAYVMSRMISEQLTEEQRQRQLAQIPVGRFCEPEEVAHAVGFLVSPLAGFITGEVIDMNGGLHFD